MISDVESRGTVLTVSSPYEKRSTWCIVGESLSQFIEEYFDARGDKFWERI